jgi:hypothetical protein
MPKATTDIIQQKFPSSQDKKKTKKGDRLLFIKKGQFETSY